jgi:hypothetical protein
MSRTRRLYHNRSFSGNQGLELVTPIARSRPGLARCVCATGRSEEHGHHSLSFAPSLRPRRNPQYASCEGAR